MNIESLISLVAVAGGGGSSSGGGGGGFGFLMALAGYAPMHGIAALVRKHSTNKGRDNLSTEAQIGTWFGGIAFALFWLIVGIFLSINSVHGFLSLVYFGILPMIGAVIGTGAGLYNWFSRIKQSKEVKAALASANNDDKMWDEARLTTGAENVFQAFQSDWSNGNIASTKAYLTSNYANHIELMMLALKQIGRINYVENPQIENAQIVAIKDAASNDEDSFVIGIEATAIDKLIDQPTNKTLYSNKQKFTEFWRFKRDGKSWRLDGIQPATEAAWTNVPTLESFAAENGFYYSLDWGRLLLPTRGQLFNGGSFATADINNHCIGWHQSTFDRILTQIYTYRVNPDKIDTYIIAQATLPRSYGNIVVRRKKGKFRFKIKGLREVSTEWQDFNKMYQVFATSAEQATSFELLNPKYMEQIASIPFDINIEVVDNILYLYSPLEGVTAKSKVNHPISQSQDTANKYQMMLWALAAAFKEMKM